MPSLLTRVQNLLDARFLDRLVASRRGRGFLLNALIDAEEGDEAGVFDRMQADVGDPQLAKVIRTHQLDEERHAAQLTACLTRLGLPRVRTPDHLRSVPHINAALGDVGAAYLDGRAGVVEAYLFLQVLEERAVVQYPRFAAAFARIDPATAATLTTIVEDEQRHVKYAIAVTRRLAPDAATLARTLARYRAAEAKAYVELGRVTARHVVDARLLEVRPPEQMLWRALAAA